MRIKSVRIQNFRAFKDQTIELDRYSPLVGPNGSGKSTVLSALNVFFRETGESQANLVELQREDFHRGDTDHPIVVTVTFCDLTADAQRDFDNYVRQEELVVSAVARFDSSTTRAPVLQFGQRRGIREFARFFEAEKNKAAVDELKRIYDTLRIAHPDLPTSAPKARMIEALRSYEDARPEESELIPSEDQFYGFSKGTNRLARHVQWVFVPAVKDASTEQTEAKDTALGKLLARTVRARLSFDEELGRIRRDAQSQYEEMLRAQQGALDDISGALKARLAEWAHPDTDVQVKWQQDPARSVRIDEPFAQIIAGEGPFYGGLFRFGHGLQRAYLLALLQELSRTGADGEPTLLLGVEEPELYQHPPQCRYMCNVLQDLTTGNSQVIITTHSPLFIAGQHFASVRLVRKNAATSEASCSFLTVDRLAAVLAEARGGVHRDHPRGVLAKIHQALQPALNEVFFTPYLVLVEGREDAAYILTYMNLLGRADSLRRVGCHVVSADRKSSLLIPFAIVKHLGIPTFLVFDADTHAPDRDGVREMHKMDNLALLRIAAVDDPDPFPAATLWTDSTVMWRTEFASEIASDFPTAEWRRLSEEAESRFGHVGGLEKNPLFIAERLEAGWAQGLRSRQLEDVCNRILAFCGAA